DASECLGRAREGVEGRHAEPGRIPCQLAGRERARGGRGRRRGRRRGRGRMKRTKRLNVATQAAIKPVITLTQAMADPTLFGKVFASPSFWTWKVVAKLIDGIPLTEPREVELSKQCTGRKKLPTKPVRRLIILAGRRAGKDRFESAVSVWRGALCADWRRYQSAGEGAVVILLGAD